MMYRERCDLLARCQADSVHALQEEFGYIDETAELLITEALNITRAEVHGVSGFYQNRAPAGRHVVKLCRGLPNR
jgi:formate dehydrogenase subunit gamma